MLLRASFQGTMNYSRYFTYYNDVSYKIIIYTNIKYNCNGILRTKFVLKSLNITYRILVEIMLNQYDNNNKLFH